MKRIILFIILFPVVALGEILLHHILDMPISTETIIFITVFFYLEITKTTKERWDD